MGITIDDLAVMMKNGFEGFESRMNKRFDRLEDQVEKVETEITEIKITITRVDKKQHTIQVDMDKDLLAVFAADNLKLAADQVLTSIKNITAKKVKKMFNPNKASVAQYVNSLTVGDLNLEPDNKFYNGKGNV